MIEMSVTQGETDAQWLRRETAAFAIYMLVRPEGAPEWPDLTKAQQRAFRNAVTVAAQSVDVARVLGRA